METILEGLAGAEEVVKTSKAWLLYRFPENKKGIAKLKYEQKMEWYASRRPEDMVWLGSDPEFQKFWKWHVLVPLRIKRLYFRVKNLEIFKHHAHISEMRRKVKKFSV